jgi:hypothetical protein
VSEYVGVLVVPGHRLVKCVELRVGGQTCKWKLRAQHSENGKVIDCSARAGGYRAGCVTVLQTKRGARSNTEQRSLGDCSRSVKLECRDQRTCDSDSVSAVSRPLETEATREAGSRR